MSLRSLFPIASLVLVVMASGCNQRAQILVKDDVKESETEPSEETAAAEIDLAPLSFEAGAKELLAARLPSEVASEGWVRLFDGHTLYGWEITGKANWRVDDGSIVVDQGEKCLLCTSTPWKDYELTLEFNAGISTNSGVFLRTSLQPEDVTTECYEVNIAPDDNPFPTGGVVKRKAVNENAPKQTFGKWRRMTMRMDGGELKITVDDEVVCEYTDDSPLPAGRIGLQHNSGKIAFRDIRLKPLGLKTMLDDDLAQWTKYPKMPGSFTTNDEGWLRVQGGRTQLESKESYGDFALLAEYKLPTAEMNSGIFFRCIPGQEMMGYECQLSNEIVDGNPLQAADHGTGGIFKRQPARIVAGEVNEWATVLLVANGPKIAAWVNGVQVSDWQDDREPDENPRKGLRLEPGTIMIQGHDKDTDATLRQLMITPL